jgi:FemAB-related protein (PEP-CTERM system-associated)
MMNIRFAGQQDKESWDIYVNNHLDAAPYSLYAWKESVEEAYGHQAIYLLAENHGTVTGILPLVNFHIPLLTRSIISLPYCDLGDIIADSEEICRGLARKAVALAIKSKVTSLEIRSRTENLLDENIGWPFQVQTGKVRMLLDLPDSSEALWKGFKSKLRSQIRKAEKNGLTFRWGSLENLSAFYDVFGRNMHTLGSPVHSRKWIEKIMANFGKNSRMGLVYKGDRAIGCGIILYTKHSVSIPWASTLREFNRLSPNMMLYWNLLQFAADQGKKKFDFGRSTLNEGTYIFKKQWGAQPKPLYWYTLTPKSSILNDNKKTSLKRQLLAELWTKMPYFLSNYLGPKLRRYISL